MEERVRILKLVRKAAQKKIIFKYHAATQMSRPARLITTKEVRKVVNDGEVIEDYPEDPRGNSCLMLGFGEDKRPIHVVCAPKDDFLALITAYLPDPNEWENDLKTRKKA